MTDHRDSPASGPAWLSHPRRRLQLFALSAVAFAALIAACSQVSTVGVETEAAGDGVAVATPTSTPILVPTPTPSPTPTPEPTPTTGPTPTPTPIPPPWVPTPGTTFQWQLSGDLDTSADVEVYGVDLFDTPDSTISLLQSRGRRVFCYFSAGSWEEWRVDASQFPDVVLGESNGWPGELWLDIRRIDVIGPIMTARLDLAVEKGCDAVEPDNVDAYLNTSGFEVTVAEQIDYLAWLSLQARSRGLSIGLKNAVGIADQVVDLFDWALNERCMEFNECALLTPFIEAGKAVFHVEYQGDLSWCPVVLELGFSSLEKDILVGPEFRPCPVP